MDYTRKQVKALFYKRRLGLVIHYLERKEFGIMINSKMILIIGSCPANREKLKGYWQGDEGYGILEADSRKGALALLQAREDVDLILLDADVSGELGLDFLSELKRPGAFPHIPVIVNVEDYDCKYEEKALELKADDFIRQPAAAGIVKRRASNVIKKNAYDKGRKDALTGIYNYETFCLQAGRMLKEDAEKEYVVLQFHIVKFILINELFGRETGDEILAGFAGSLAKAVGNRGVYGRMKSDHFLCCIPHEEAEEGSSFSRILQEGVEEYEKRYSFITQAGIYIVGNRELPVAVMCDRAGLACQSISTNMERRFAYYDEQAGEKFLEEQGLLRDTRDALESGQFYIEMQPIYDLRSRQLSSAEALVRWEHPQKGLIYPGTFVPLLEKSGLITRLDMFVAEEVCKVLSEFEKEGIPQVPVSVNISRIDFGKMNLVEEINGLTEKYGIEKRLLKIEVTESACVDTDEIIGQVDELRREGYDVLMDDFGGGYSSLGTLKELPIDILKIDMGLMNRLEDSKRTANIVYCIVQMAKMLGIQTIAEGVENERQVEFLKEIGCDRIQGYFYSHPMKLAEYKKILEQGKEKPGPNGLEEQVQLMFKEQDLYGFGQNIKNL